MGTVVEGMVDGGITGGASTAPEQSPTTPPQVQARSIGARLRQTSVFTLSTEGNKYLEAIMDCNTRTKCDYAIEPVQGPEIHACLIVHPNRTHAILLGFDETVSKTYPDHPEPSVLLMTAVKDQISSRRLKIINTIIVHQTDYVKPAAMFNSICQMFQIATDDPSVVLTHASFDGHMLTASTNLLEAEKWLKHNSPHEVMPRMNLAITLKVVEKGTDGKPTNNISTLAVLPAYVDFIMSPDPSFNPMMSMGPRYKAILHFEAHSTEPEPALLGIFAPVLTERYAVNFGWLDQFNVYAPDKINLGNLVAIDVNGTPYHIPDPNHRQNFAYMNIEPIAVLCLDVMVGKAQIPFSQYLTDESLADMDKLKNRIANFFGVTPAEVPDPIKRTTDAIHECCGLVKQDGYIDDRYIDYLWAVKVNGNTEIPKVFKYLYPKSPNKPFSSVRAKEKHIMFPNTWVPLYLNLLRFINPEFITAMSRLMSQKGLKLNGFDNETDQRYGNPAYLGIGDFAQGLSGFGSVTSGVNTPGSRYSLTGLSSF